MADTEWDPVANPRKIKKYEVVHLSNVKGLDHTTRVAIYLYDASDDLFGILRFKMDPADVDRDRFTSGGSSGRLHCFYPPESYAEVMDLLRNEKPLYLSQDDEGYCHISSRKEPVGEEES